LEEQNRKHDNRMKKIIIQFVVFTTILLIGATMLFGCINLSI